MQFLPAIDKLDMEALNGAVEVSDDFGSDEQLTTYILTAHHVVATALRTGRYKDHARVIAFFDEGAVHLEALKAVVVNHGLLPNWQNFITKTGYPDVLNLGSLR